MYARLTLGLLLALAPLSHAATRYVATTGSNAGANTCLNVGTPCQTINYAGAQASGGDTISIAPGVYVESIQCGGFPDGTPGAYTTLQGSGPGVIIRSDDAPGIDCQGSGSWLAFRGLVIDGQHQNGSGGHNINIDGAFSHLFFSHLDVRYGPGSGMIAGSTTTHVTVQFSTFHHVGFTPAGLPICEGDVSNPNPDDGYCHGIYTFSPGMVIRGNHIYSNNGLGAQIYASAVNVQNNMVYDNQGFGLFNSDHESGQLSRGVQYNCNLVWNNTNVGIAASGTNTRLKSNRVYGNEGGNIALTLGAYEVP